MSNKEYLKPEFLEEFNKTLANASQACQKVGISFTTYQRWCEKDPEFAEACQAAKERRTDFAEGKLMEQINANDTTAIIFYLKTQGKNRGWTERIQPKPSQNVENEQPTIDEKILKKIEQKKRYITSLLKKEGKYSVELTFQVTLAAQLLVKTELEAQKVFSSGHSTIYKDTTRMGNTIIKESPQDESYRNYLQKAQDALRALGMNVDSKPRKTEDNSLDDFINAINSPK